MSAQLIERIVEIIETGQESRAGLARAAGLHANSLRKLGEPDWNPTAETLGKLERYLSRDPAGVMATAEEIINEARNGRMYILVDDEDRENEGDLIIPAQMATPDAINFMAKYGRGLICLAMTRDRVEQLGLNLMSRNNGTRHETAFTVSIEAKEGVTTGISAHDRAKTIAVAIDPTRDCDDIVSPGHVFPLVAKDGGTLELVVLPAHAPMIQHVIPEIIERVNRFFGYNAVAQVKLRQGAVKAPVARPAAAPPSLKPVPVELGESLRDIGDPELRAVLEGLARGLGADKD